MYSPELQRLRRRPLAFQLSLIVRNLLSTTYANSEPRSDCSWPIGDNLKEGIVSKIDDLKTEETESSEAFDELADLVTELVTLLMTASGGQTRSDDPDSEWVRFPKQTVRRFREIQVEWS